MAQTYTVVNATTTDPTSITSWNGNRFWYVPPDATGAWAGKTDQLAYTLDPSDPQSWEFAVLYPGDQVWNDDTSRHYLWTSEGLKRVLTEDDLIQMAMAAPAGGELNTVLPPILRSRDPMDRATFAFMDAR